MRTILCSACFLLLASLPASAGRSASDTSAHPAAVSTAPFLPAGSAEPGTANSFLDSLPKHFSWSAQVMAFGRATNFVKKMGTVNPENRIAKLNRTDGGLYLRPEFKWESGSFEVVAKPRLNININGDKGGLFQRDKYDNRLYMQELKAKWQLNQRIYVIGGRYVKYMGTSAFFNPSNPFILDNLGTLNPKLEIEPMDFVELNWSAHTDWNFSFIANLGDAGKSIYQAPFFRFKRSYGLFGEYYGDSENFGFLATVDEAHRYHGGWYGHKNISEALVLWTDCALDYNPNRFYPVAGHHTNLLNYEMVNDGSNNRGFFTGLLGGSYTFKTGPTLQVNYLYNGKGYNSKQMDLYNQMISTAANYNFDITKDLANLNLGRALNTGTLYLRHHYVFSQLGDSDVFGQLDYNFRYLYSFDDRGSQLSSLLEWNLKDNMQLYSVTIGNFGKQTDLNKLLRFQVMLGLIFKM
ncbi:MAG: hypothetical protein INR73_01265 [Williamsia sp.]|nr:hypothetical protein [Williamsia sp.]